ncbi:hypothetical protein ACSBR2_036118 [Camellia fascicularis]
MECISSIKHTGAKLVFFLSFFFFSYYCTFAGVKIKFCCLQSKAAEPYMRLCGVDQEDVLRRFLFIEGPGLYHQGSTAALRVLSYLPLPYSALNTLLVVLIPLRDIVYDYVAKRRYNWFGKEDDCLVLQEKELLEQFIDWEEMLDLGRRDL